MLIRFYKYQAKIAFFLLWMLSCSWLSEAASSLGTIAAMDNKPDQASWNENFRFQEPKQDLFGFTSGEAPKIEVNTINPFLGPDRLGGDVPDIDGPGQPEMKSFQSVNADNMVDLFTGDFSYSIPLLDVGGYPVNLHYSSGITMDQEASWVGLGWNINPGSISRSMRGLPDDFDGINDVITKTQHVKPNTTVGVTIEPSVEIKGYPLNVSARLGLYYNTYRGFGMETGVGIGGTGRTAFGSLTGRLSISNNSQEGINISPSIGMEFGKNSSDDYLHGTLGVSTGFSSRAGLSNLQINGGVATNRLLRNSERSNFGGPEASISFATPSYTPMVSMPITNKAFSFTGKVGGEIMAVDASASFTGYGNTQEIAPEDVTQKIPAAGYLYSTNANGRENVLLDFNREKELEFNYKTTPHIALPQYTYDAFSISGEGTGGSFRAYRGDVGYMFDHSISSRSSSTNGSVDVGYGAYAHVGLEITDISTSSTNHRWKQDNKMESKLSFQSADTTYEPVYFRNPGEKTTNAKSYYRSIGDDSLIRIKLSGSKTNIQAENALVKYSNSGRPDTEIPVNEALVKKQRDKRTQVISYLTAKETVLLGLDRSIKSYKENSIPVGACSDTVTLIPRVDQTVHKQNHLSEISVLNSDGRRYVYGLPVYNVQQQDVSFAVDEETNSTNLSKGLVAYAAADNSIANTKGKDGYYSKEEMPAYAHNFLITGILSTDYVDITGDGISDDDLGDAVKFNYSQIYGINNGYYDWRIPFDADKANYNPGLKTYNRDDKASISYGKKEIWYLNSVESKTMIAVFRTMDDRQDTYAANGVNGGLNTSKGTRRLQRIDLYVKADIIRNGVGKAKPVKSVHFEYSYDLCKGAQGNSGIGKLTLKKVWFTYNKNNKGQLNPYVFFYNPDNNGAPKSEYNPSFNSRSTDRWGSYKDPTDNPAGLSNDEFPYSLQDSVKAAANASMWNLTEIRLPSGGKMKITYEADDYGYVQNRRATMMTTIAGVEESGKDKLYNARSKDDYYKIFVNVPGTAAPLGSKADIRARYLNVDDIIYFKLAVKMPTDQFGSGYEMVPGYGKIEDYGISPGNSRQFWIRLAAVDSRSPLSRAAIQFLRLNLPSKAYPNSEGLDKISLGNLIKMFATGFAEIKNMVMGFDDAAKSRHQCEQVVLSKSFLRLSAPDLKKLGGGYRVKRVEIYDNWKKMTDQRESVYGQEYNYRTTEQINGKRITISSGVATYEPMIGAEENPFRKPIAYNEKVAPMGPVNYMFSEEPIGESYFAAPMVGYSKVRIRTINAKAKSANGWTESEFYTSRDFPTLVEHTLLEEGSSKLKYETKSDILRLNHKNFVTLSQGFRIELNDMNGKMKAQSSYAETDSLHPTSYSLNFYKTDNPTAPQQHLNNNVWVVDSISGHIDTMGSIGKDIEVMADLREQRSASYTRGFSPNVDIVATFIPFFPVVIVPSKLNLPQQEQTRFRSAALVKVVLRYGILDSVVVMDKGSVVSTKNLLYDAETGNVVLSRTNNEYNDPIYNFNYPAYWAYSGMGMAYKNLGALFQAKKGTAGLQLNKGRLFKEGSSEAYPAERHFESGDEVYVWAGIRMNQSVDCRFLQIPTLGFFPIASPWFGKLWVVDAAKGKEGDHGLFFVDENGNVAPDMMIARMTITRSGRRNMPDVSAGSVVMMNNPLKKVSNNYRVVIDSTTRVLNATTATFKDLWKVENSAYQIDSCYAKIDSVETYLPATVSVVRGGFIRDKGGFLTEYYNVIDHSLHTMASYDYVDSATTGYRADRWDKKKSILNFNLNSIPANATVTQSRIYLFPKPPINSAYYDGTNYNWQNPSMPWKLNEYTSYLARVTGLGNNYDYYMVSTANRLTLPAGGADTCSPGYSNSLGLAQDLLSNRADNKGLMLYLANETKPTSTHTKFLSYANSNCVGCMIGDTSAAIRIQDSTYNFGVKVPSCAPVLYIKYQISRDTCEKVCRQNIVDSATNPYRWGILGSWRMERSYVYYNDREENDATQKKTNIRNEGTLKAFMPYWTFSAGGLTASADSSRWVWNSAISGFNRKGFEIENYDALGRYNAGLYGYNSTLPVAVAQNSRYQELLFDSFEDYGYKTKPCATCPPEREYDFLKNNSGVDTSRAQSHTGLYSLKVNSGSEAVFSVATSPIADSLDKNPGPLLSVKIDSTAITATTVVGAGTGLKGTYTWGRNDLIQKACIPSGTPELRTDSLIKFDWTRNIIDGIAPPGTGGCTDSYVVTWLGSIQPRYSDWYELYFQFSGTASVSINNRTVLNVTDNQIGERVTAPIYLQAGQLYKIAITYYKAQNFSQGGPVVLQWSSKVNQQKEVIPKRFLYPDSPLVADTTGSIQNTVLYYCVSSNAIKSEKAIKEKFSPLADTKLTISAWVRQDVEDCNSTPALDSAIQVQVNTGTSTWLKKTGVRIEGWQRYEANVYVPGNATSITFRVKTLESTGIYVDDIRVQPYNSGMKGFVYNPINLRLMADLDENNYASFYEYDDDGTLIRVKKETERGIITIRETRSALLKE